MPAVSNTRHSVVLGSPLFPASGNRVARDPWWGLERPRAGNGRNADTVTQSQARRLRTSPAGNAVRRDGVV